MDGFERRKAQSKDEILRAAEELFSRFGTDKVSVNDIARRAGVSQATIYNNFGSKDSLVRDYRSTVVKKIASTFRGIIVMKKSWVEKFQGFLQSWVDIADRYRLEVGETNRTPVGAGGDQPENAIENEIDSTLREFIEEGRRQGRLRHDLSEDAVMTYIDFFRQGITSDPAVHKRMLRDSRYSEEILSLFVYGLAGKAE
jgi:AcrR family transcriptional regulator